MFPTPPTSGVASSTSRPSSASSLEVTLRSPLFPEIFQDLPEFQESDPTMDVLPQNQAQLAENQGVGWPDLNNSASFSPPQQLQDFEQPVSTAQPISPREFI